jgi:transcriptional regulator with XRE-family HTH domain
MAMDGTEVATGRPRTVVRSQLRASRLGAGIRTRHDLAERAGIEPVWYWYLESGRALPGRSELLRLAAALEVPVERLYPDHWRQILKETPAVDRPHDIRYWYEILRGPEKLLVSPEEMSWYERRPRPAERSVDVYISLSCNTRHSPHLLLDTVSICEALGISFVAAAGPAGCCGSPYQDDREGEARWVGSKTDLIASLGARTNVNWCTNCQVRLPRLAKEREEREGIVHPLREVQILTFFEERIRQLGSRVPWKQRVQRRVLVEGHSGYTDVHREAQRASAGLLSQIPGVHVAATYDGGSDSISPCGFRNARPPGAPEWRPVKTTADVRERRRQLEEMIASLGADTVSCQHQACHQFWSRYATDRLHVVHPVSILAEALGCAHPDRYQAATRLGDPAAIVEQTRPIWSAWHLSEAKALRLAEELADPRFAEGVTSCGCGRERCDEQLISVDVLTARST